MLAGHFRQADNDLWIFGYGSLMWRPGFAFVRAEQARLDGYHRCFCVYTIHHRGTPARPGMVLGLDRGGSCEGMAFLVPAAQAEDTRRYLAEREYAGGAYPYREARLPVTLLQPGRPQVSAITYLVERRHVAFADGLALPRQAEILRGAAGRSGGNIEYLLSTLAHLAALGIRERQLERLRALLAPHLIDGRLEGRGLSGAGIRAAARRRPIALPRLNARRDRGFIHRHRLSIS